MFTNPQVTSEVFSCEYIRRKKIKSLIRWHIFNRLNDKIKKKNKKYPKICTLDDIIETSDKAF